MSVVRSKTAQSLREDLAANVRRYRAKKAPPPAKPLSQERCAWEAGIDRTMMSKIERAKTNPSLDTLLKLANYLNVSVADLLTEREATPPPTRPEQSA
ncbi:MAG: HTH-type transcriptional regulator sinR [Pseudomonadota bacterium]|jgi:transcriptional regulator with XRE-family HTH domain